MFADLKKILNNKWGGCALAGLAVVFLLAGFGMASAFHRTAASEARSNLPGPPAAAPFPSAPASFAELAKKLSPTVVHIKVVKVERAGNFPGPRIPEGPFGDFFKQFPQPAPQGPESRPVQATGSGVIISADGYILTNNHVVEGSGTTKAFTGKGDVLRLARQAGECMDDLAGQMRRLSRTSKQAAGGGVHYLDLHRRTARSGTSCSLRWRSPLHRHVRWTAVARDLRRLPLGLHLSYREMNRRACELNALHGLCRMQRAVLERLARACGEDAS